MSNSRSSELACPLQAAPFCPRTQWLTLCFGVPACGCGQQPLHCRMAVSMTCDAGTWPYQVLGRPELWRHRFQCTPPGRCGAVCDDAQF